ncbi:MAG: hypothetical protein ING73_05115 [Rhodocyclaceae bacterium]|nr:hypothetical protein [Rhodocyclaceae bacterium]MCA3023717.1 hypothetical protein [Rhodocyclaceae bacterium]MCA3030372.1 hypothetical protein [Rhodocyclaceae bacterium]MCA3035704.1 hypothetical protein [Rhodocyclaceae bacterium]MCA3045608.1 hypothetical protein [Rhodocyclaceae bacterium]
MKLRQLVVLCCACQLTLAVAQQSPAPALEWKSGDLTLRGGVDAHAAYYSMSGAWWNLAASAAPTYNTDRSFGELWLHPKLNGRYDLAAERQLYGALSLGLTKTLGADAFDNRNKGAVRLENAHIGIRGKFDKAWYYDFSAGRQPFTLGTGMLLAAGSSNGTSWGAAASTPRKAWEQTVIARLGSDAFSGQLFYLEPAETPETRTNTRLHGASLEWAKNENGKVGLAWLEVPKSAAVYPGNLAPLVFIENGRAGLKTWHGWLDLNDVVPGLKNLGLRAEFAVQRNDIKRANGRIDPMKANAWLLGASYWAQTLPFAPRFSYHRARFSGDKPDTQTYERFDPLFWGNGLNNWWFGANGSYAWINSNLQVQRFIIDAYASARDILQFQYVRTSADELNSAIQYGQGARFGPQGLLVGVPKRELSDECYLQYVRVFSSALTGVIFVSHNTPGAGLKAVAPQGVRNWTTLGFLFSASF